MFSFPEGIKHEENIRIYQIATIHFLLQRSFLLLINGNLQSSGLDRTGKRLYGKSCGM